MKKFFFIALIVLFGYGTVYCQNKTGINNDPVNKAPLDELTETGEANIWFLGHCGFAVQTLNYFLIFDYVEDHLREVYETPDNPSLLNGFINPQEIIDLKVRVFATHEHGDHFDPVIFQWADHIADIEYFFGWQSSNNADYHYFPGPRATWLNDNLEVYTINSYHSGIPEVAYLIKVDDSVIYYNGDYQGDYQEDMKYLRTKTGNIDIAFLFGIWQEQWKYFNVNHELITQLKPAAVFPMHIRIGDEKEYFLPFKAKFDPMLDNGHVVLTNNIKGISLYYKNHIITKN